MREQSERTAEAVRAESDDWLVIVSIMGGGSWARGKDRDQTIERCKRIVRSDWKSLFSFKKGTVIKANVLDVTGFDRIEWGDRGVTADGKPYPGKIEQIEMRF